MPEKKTYLCIHEAPCVGVDHVLIEASCDKEAEDIAWKQSVENRYYTMGGYELYRVMWDYESNTHKLVEVVPIDEEGDEV